MNWLSGLLLGLSLGFNAFAAVNAGLDVDERAALDQYLAQGQTSKGNAGAKSLSEFNKRLEMISAGASERQAFQESSADWLARIAIVKTMVNAHQQRQSSNPYVDSVWKESIRQRLTDLCCNIMANERWRQRINRRIDGNQSPLRHPEDLDDVGTPTDLKSVPAKPVGRKK